MAKEKSKVASVLAFEKKLVPSDGMMYGTTWDKREHKTALKLVEKSVRGTIANREKASIANDPAKLNAKIEEANLQTVDSCALEAKQDTLVLNFTLKVLGGIKEPSACNNSEFLITYQAAVTGYIEREAFKELGLRYALNIANGRFLWRNRVGTESIEVKVKDLISKESWEFDAKSFDIRSMQSEDEKVLALGEKIAKTLANDDDFLMLEITTYAKVGKAQEVYPSEELVLYKNTNNKKAKKSKILYAVDGVAAMHSQKIGNALRSIDTWYPEFGTKSGNGAIAIEPYGAVTNMGKAFRAPKEKKDFYSLFDKFAQGESLDSVEDEHYVMAVLVRGGVFGQSDK